MVFLSDALFKKFYQNKDLKKKNKKTGTSMVQVDIMEIPLH